MYKQIIICIIIVLLVIALDIWTQTYTKESVTEIIGSLNELKESVMLEKLDIAKEQIDETINKWDKRYEHLSYYIEHNELEKVKTELVGLKANVEVEQYGEAAGDIDRSIFILEHIKQKMELQIKNIF